MNNQQELFYRPPEAIARRTDPDTSHAAAKSLAADKISAIQQLVLEYFKAHRTGIDEQVCYALRFRYGPSTVRTRRKELVDKGLLRDSGKRALNVNGRSVIVWELV